MSIAPEPELRACMEVVSRAIIDARFSAMNNNVDPQRLADLMDAVHNIPQLIQNWDTCDQNLLKGMLGEYDRKWNSPKLVACLRAGNHDLSWSTKNLPVCDFLHFATCSGVPLTKTLPPL